MNIVSNKNKPQKLYKIIKEHINDEKCFEQLQEANIGMDLANVIIYACYDNNDKLVQALLNIKYPKTIIKTCHKSIAAAIKRRNIKILKLLLPHVEKSDSASRNEECDNNTKKKHVIHAYTKNYCDVIEVLCANNFPFDVMPNHVYPHNLLFHAVKNNNVEMTKSMLKFIDTNDTVFSNYISANPFVKSFEENNIEIFKLLCNTKAINQLIERQGVCQNKYYMYDEHLLLYIFYFRYTLKHCLEFFNTLLQYYIGNPAKILCSKSTEMQYQYKNTLFQHSMDDHNAKCRELLNETKLFACLLNIINDYVY